MASLSPAVTVHKHLDDATTEIRLFHIHPATHDEPITGDLEKLTRSDQLVYCALSYVWGSKEDTRTITIDEQEVHITANCEAAIRRLRDENESTTIWIDAICINQADAVEKGAQIGQMRDIYRAAAHVFVWLGEEDSETAPAFDLLTQVGSLGRYNAEEATSLTIGSPLAWTAVDNLFKREWFERIWIVQEVSLAKQITIRCGSKQLTWTTFNRALQWIREDKDYIGRGMYSRDSLFTNAIQLRNAWGHRYHGSGVDSKLEQLLLIFGHWKASDLLDKVNALLGMSEEHAVTELQPDYTKSVCEVYANVVKFLITRDRRLSILGQCQNPSMYKKLPSWVPDWTPDRPYRMEISETYRPQGDAQVMMTSNGGFLVPSSLSMPDGGYGTWEQESMVREEMNFAASLDLLAESYFPSTGDTDPPKFVCPRGTVPKLEETMKLKGVEVDTIDSVTAPLFRTKEDIDDPIFFLEWERFAIFQMPAGVACPYGDNFGARIDAFWRTISTDRIHEVRGNLRAIPRCRDLFEQWRAKLIRDARPADAYIPETADTVDPGDTHARARAFYNFMAGLSLSEHTPSEDTDTEGHPVHSAPRSIEEEVLRDYESWKQKISQLEIPIPVYRTESKSSPGLREEYTMASFEATLRTFCFARKLARTKAGRLALVPEHARPGDKVFVLYGGSVPYVLRAIPGRYKYDGHTVDEEGIHGEAGATYLIYRPLHQFIGETYVHGIMDGEALNYPPIERIKRFRQVEQQFNNPRGVPELDQYQRITVFKEVLDPLTDSQQMIVDAWRLALKRREQDVWFDSLNSSDLV